MLRYCEAKLANAVTFNLRLRLPAHFEQQIPINQVLAYSPGLAFCKLLGQNFADARNEMPINSSGDNADLGIGLRIAGRDGGGESRFW